MSIKAALLLISSAPITTALLGKLNFLCHQNYVATWTLIFLRFQLYANDNYVAGNLIWFP